MGGLPRTLGAPEDADSRKIDFWRRGKGRQNMKSSSFHIQLVLALLVWKSVGFSHLQIGVCKWEMYLAEVT